MGPELARGGMGVVYLGVDAALGRKVAIKVLPEDLARDPERLARFEREAKLLASLNHPNIATIHGLGNAEGVSFLAMELIDGVELTARSPTFFAGSIGFRTYDATFAADWVEVYEIF